MINLIKVSIILCRLSSITLSRSWPFWGWGRGCGRGRDRGLCRERGCSHGRGRDYSLAGVKIPLNVGASVFVTNGRMFAPPNLPRAKSFFFRDVATSASSNLSSPPRVCSGRSGRHLIRLTVLDATAN